LLLLIGLFGYVWRQRIFSRPFWMIFVPVSLVWHLLYEFVLHNPGISPGHVVTRMPEIVLVGIFLSPLYFALFRYAFSDVVAHKDRASQATQAM